MLAEWSGGRTRKPGRWGEDRETTAVGDEFPSARDRRHGEVRARERVAGGDRAPNGRIKLPLASVGRVHHDEVVAPAELLTPLSLEGPKPRFERDDLRSNPAKLPVSASGGPQHLMRNPDSRRVDIDAHHLLLDDGRKDISLGDDPIPRNDSASTQTALQIVHPDERVDGGCQQMPRPAKRVEHAKRPDRPGRTGLRRRRRNEKRRSTFGPVRCQERSDKTVRDHEVSEVACGVDARRRNDRRPVELCTFPSTSNRRSLVGRDASGVGVEQPRGLGCQLRALPGTRDRSRRPSTRRFRRAGSAGRAPASRRCTDPG